MELDGRVLRLTIETEKRQHGATKTDAEKDAKADPQYLEHERLRIQLSFDQAVLEADAESAAYEVQLHLALLKQEVAR